MGKGTAGTRSSVPAVKAASAIEPRIFTVRGERVMLDEDLAALYGVLTKVLNQAARRNRTRFPEDFMFQLSAEEEAALRSQIVTSNAGGRGGRRYRPYVFTEQGVAMLSSVLNSERAIAVNILIMRAFVQLRRAQGHYTELRALIKDLAEQVAGHDDLLTQILEALAALERTPPRTAHPIGFRPTPRASAVRARRSR